jgi:hypothetical protein
MVDDCFKRGGEQLSVIRRQDVQALAPSGPGACHVHKPVPAGRLSHG